MRVLLADDHALVRAGIRALLEELPDVCVIGESSNGRDAVRETRRLKPDVVIMDMSMPELNGAEATQRIISDCPETRVLVLSMHNDSRYVQRMLQAGASGYLLKDSAPEELGAAIAVLRKKGVYLSSGITGVVVEDYVRRLANGSDAKSVLSSREREVLQLIAEGRSTTEIAKLLNLSTKTVESHRKRVMDKLGLYSVAELTRYAISQGIVPMDP